MEHIYKKSVRNDVTSADVEATKNKIRKLREVATKLRNDTATKLEEIRREVISATAWLKRHEHKIKDVSTRNKDVSDGASDWDVEGGDNPEHPNQR